MDVLIWMFVLIFARSPEAGSRSYISAIGLGEDSQGKFWKNDRFEESGQCLDTKEGQAYGDVVWKEVVEILTKVDAEIPKIVGPTQV